MALRRIRNEAEALSCLEAADRSGLGRVAWCRRMGVDARSLNAWRLNLARRGGPAPSAAGPRLVELVVGDPLPERASVIRVLHGSYVVECDGLVDGEALRRVLWAVSQC